MIQGQKLSEIRDSTIRDLLEKVRRQNYQWFLSGLRLDKIRLFAGATISFDFPVVALIGPNGGGKTTVLAACGCVYSESVRQTAFRKSRLGDEGMDGWRIEYELIDKSRNPRGTVRGDLLYADGRWINAERWLRELVFLDLRRTLPFAENPRNKVARRLAQTIESDQAFHVDELPAETSDRIRAEGEKVLGKPLREYQFFVVTHTRKRLVRWNAPPRFKTTKQTISVGKNEMGRFSELNFGSGESSVLRIIADIESRKDGSLVLIDEIENGLHPIAVQRLVEYLIDVAARKKIQTIFTTHSDYALVPLPDEAIWASIEGRLKQGRLSVEALRAISGRIDKVIAIFVEDEFARHWILAIIRDRLGGRFDQIGIYTVGGDSNAQATHLAHSANPAVASKSLCFIDGDSRVNANPSEGVYRLPDGVPESRVFNDVLADIESNIALLTVACQRPLDRQAEVEKAIQSVSHTNRDPHLLFVQVGEKLGFVPEAVVRGAFLAVWIQENKIEVDQIVAPIAELLEQEFNS